jgi:drug/metabolite transporter (DMT)-like permease
MVTGAGEPLGDVADVIVQTERIVRFQLYPSDTICLAEYRMIYDSPMREGEGDKPADGILVDGALLIVVLIWGSSYTVLKLAWRQMDPLAFTAIQYAAMIPIAVALGIGRGGSMPPLADWPALVASGLTGFFLFQMLFVVGLDRTSALASAILIATHPIFSVLFMWLSGRERPKPAEIAGVAVGFIGVAVFLQAWRALESARPGDLLSLGAAASFGAYAVINRPLIARYPPRKLLAYGLIVGGPLIVLLGAPALVRQDWVNVGFPAWGGLVYGILGPSYIAYILWNWAIGQRGVPRTVVYGFLVPVLGAALAVVALDDPVKPEQAIGAVLVLVGLLITRLGPHSELSPPMDMASPQRVAMLGGDEGSQVDTSATGKGAP